MISMALAHSTRKNYTKSGHQFNSFRWQSGLCESWPILVPQLMQFCVYLKDKGLSVGSIWGKLAVLAFASKAAGVPKATDDFQLRKMLEGWSRETGVHQDFRAPLSPAILHF